MRWLAGAPASLPPDLEIAMICERFHVLPSQVKKENVHDMRRVMALLHEVHRDSRSKPNG